MQATSFEKQMSDVLRYNSITGFFSTLGDRDTCSK